ncbi:hypothetical protein Bbelb_071480 [Branchiostoma belcheri]|nr:hypothetical protein Bbelb_071480 [Branchiostoma belcheri]
MARTTNYSWLLLSLVLPCAVVPCVGENPPGCRIFRGILVCLFQHHSLTDLPSGIPDDVVSLDASFNSIRNLTHVPLLDNLCTLNLRSNRIETVSWVSLRRLPALQNIHLNDNKITSVNLDVVINHLPDLKLVDLSSNRLTSVSVQGLGLPFLEQVNIDNNPFNCDCALLWLMNKVRCLQECPRAGVHCCYECEACFLYSRLNHDSLLCTSPDSLQGLSLTKAVYTTQKIPCEARTTVSTQTAGREQVATTASTLSFSVKHRNADRISTPYQAGVRETPVSLVPTVEYVVYTNPLGGPVFSGPVLENNTSIQEGNSKEISELAIGSEQIIIMVSVSFLALLFILCIMRKIRRVTSEEDTVGAAAVNTSTAIDSFSAGAPGLPTLTSTDMCLAQIVPPIKNLMYQGNLDTGEQQLTTSAHQLARTCMARMMPPIIKVNTDYHNLNAGTPHQATCVSYNTCPGQNMPQNSRETNCHQYQDNLNAGTPRQASCDSYNTCQGQGMQQNRNTTRTYMYQDNLHAGAAQQASVDCYNTCPGQPNENTAYEHVQNSECAER